MLERSCRGLEIVTLTRIDYLDILVVLFNKASELEHDTEVYVFLFCLAAYCSRVVAAMACIKHNDKRFGSPCGYWHNEVTHIYIICRNILPEHNFEVQN